jgi:hypothetical protein
MLKYYTLSQEARDELATARGRVQGCKDALREQRETALNSRSPTLRSLYRKIAADTQIRLAIRLNELAGLQRKYL